MDPVSSSPPSGPALSPAPGRRSFLGWLTYGLGAVAAAAVGLPFIGYLFGARKAPVRWLSLGRVTDFPQGQTRLVTFDNPISQPWDGMVAHTGVFVRQRRTRRRPAAARPLPLRVPGCASRRCSPAGGPGAALSDPAGHPGTGMRGNPP